MLAPTMHATRLSAGDCSSIYLGLTYCAHHAHNPASCVIVHLRGIHDRSLLEALAAPAASSAHSITTESMSLFSALPEAQGQTVFG
jgi:hypothetical protein